MIKLTPFYSRNINAYNPFYEMERLEKEKQSELRSYKGLMVAEKMTSNKDIASGSKSFQEVEEDFM
jgi:predicted nucleotide-binding protein (sugar kinase/HSP70/actin superfamily)